MTTGTVYTETVVHMAPEQFRNEAPYQLAIVTLEVAHRPPCSIAGHRVQHRRRGRIGGRTQRRPFFRNGHTT